MGVSLSVTLPENLQFRENLQNFQDLIYLLCTEQMMILNFEFSAIVYVPFSRRFQ